MDPKILAYHARAGAVDWSDRESVVEYSTGAWRLLAGTAHPFDEAGVRALAAQDFDRTGNLLTPMNHALLSGGERWYNRLNEVRVPALIIHGTQDPVLPYAHGLALVEALPQATLLTLKGTGHELHRNDWDAIIEALETHTAQ
jgi:pimeloyl-ACP methyl ester carboxylesterase